MATLARPTGDRSAGQGIAPLGVEPCLARIQRLPQERALEGRIERIPADQEPTDVGKVALEGLTVLGSAAGEAADRAAIGLDRILSCARSLLC